MYVEWMILMNIYLHVQAFSFADILDDSVSLEMFFADNDLELLENAAEKMVKVIERLKVIQELIMSES